MRGTLQQGEVVDRVAVYADAVKGLPGLALPSLPLPHSRDFAFAITGYTLDAASDGTRCITV